MTPASPSVVPVRPKAITSEGELFPGVSCYVLDNEQRVVVSGHLAAVLGGKSGPASLAHLKRGLSRLPNSSVLLAALPVLDFSPPQGGLAKGIDAESIVDILQLYVDALDAGALHASQVPVAMRAMRMISALAKTGVVALVDEATGYQEHREARSLAFVHRALMLETPCSWDPMWDADFVTQICKLHGERYTGGQQPRWLASTYNKLYELVLGADVIRELKRRNPDPKFGTNHHQWLTPEARAVLRKQVPMFTLLAEQSLSKDEFWARVEHRYANRPLQTSFYLPARKGAA